MHTSQKGFGNVIAIVIAVVVLAGAVGYVSFKGGFLKLNVASIPAQEADNASALNPASSTPPFASPPIATSTPIAAKPPLSRSGINATVIGGYCNGMQPANPPTDYKPCGEEMLALFALRIKNDVSGGGEGGNE